MRKWIYIPIIGIIIGELLILYDKILVGLGIHIVGILTIILIIIFGNLSLKTKNILQCLILLPLLRIMRLSIPQLSDNIFVQYMIIYGIMFVPIYLIMRNDHILLKESETNLSILLYSSRSFGKVYIYMNTIILVIIITAMIGQYVSMISSAQTILPEVTYIIEEIISIFLIITLSISLLVSNTKYWNEYISNSIDIYSYPLLLTLVTIIIHKIMFII